MDKTKRYEIHISQFSARNKAQYYIWDAKLKITVVEIREGGIRKARKIRKIYQL